MNIALIDETKIIKIADYRVCFPNCSFSLEGPDDDFLKYNNAKRINLYIDHDHKTHKLVPCEPYIDGEWVYTVKVEPLTAEEINSLNNSQAQKIRMERNLLLQECDWTQCADVKMTDEKKQEWLNYRDSLRNLSEQQDFPWNIIWPEKPV